jgi:hypothetical protein
VLRGPAELDLAMEFAFCGRFRQIHRVRWLASLMVLLFCARAHAAGPASNPSFLGIEMDPAGDGCVVRTVTSCSPAQDAGLRFGDFIVAMDGKPLVDIRIPAAQRLTACDVLRDQVMAHAPGDTVTYELHRGGSIVTLKATLSTRADVQHRCFVGQQMPSIEVEDIDNRTHESNLAELRGRTTVVAWFRLEHCVGCGVVFDRIADGMSERVHGDIEPQIVGVTPVKDGEAPPKRGGLAPSVPVWLADDRDFREVTLTETERIQLMVVDCHGVIQFVAPLAPGSDDVDAAIDEVLAAVEQAEYSRTRR